MNWPKKCCIFVLAVMIAAVALRLPRLGQRPMHGDEAVHAVKFGELLEKNFYRYNPDDYHGPTLNYFTLIPAWLSGIHKFKDLNEFTLRIVPVFFGLLLVLMPLLLLRRSRPLGNDYSHRNDRHFTGICFLQSLLHSGNAPRLFYLWCNYLRLALYSEQKHRVGFINRNILRVDALN